MPKKNNEHSFLEEFKTFSIHNDDFKRLSKKTIKEISEHEQIEFYPPGKCTNKVVEFKKVLKEYLTVIKKNKGQESNIECILIDQMNELISKMYAHEVRELKLEKLLKTK